MCSSFFQMERAKRMAELEPPMTPNLPIVEETSDEEDEMPILFADAAFLHSASDTPVVGCQHPSGFATNRVSTHFFLCKPCFRLYPTLHWDGLQFHLATCLHTNASMRVYERLNAPSLASDWATFMPLEPQSVKKSPLAKLSWRPYLTPIRFCARRSRWPLPNL